MTRIVVDITGEGDGMAEGLVVTWNGAPVCELTVPPPQSLADWKRDQARAHSAIKLVDWLARLVLGAGAIKEIDDPTCKTARQTEEAWGTGFIDGLQRLTAPHPRSFAGIPPPLPPQSGVAYSYGYELGESLHRIYEIHRVGSCYEFPNETSQ